MISVSRLNVIVFLTMFLAFAFTSKIMALMGLMLSGIEYLIWMFFAPILIVINFGQNSRTLSINPLYLLLLFILLSICVLNYFFVSVSTITYLQGTFFTFLFAFNFLLFYNVKINIEDFFSILKILISIITTIAAFAYVERIFVEGDYQSYFLRGVKTIAKDPGFAATLFNINIILCFVMYLVERKKKYIYLIGFSIITIALLLFLKAFLVSLAICFFFIKIYINNNFVKYFFYSAAVLFFCVLIVLGKPLLNEIKYKASLYFGPGSEKTPRNALYIASFEIAKDYFPFGSGQGTFGSYPVGKEYSNIYYAYNLDKLHGLSKDDAMGKTDSQFVFDTHWSSILGEMGFIATFFYIWLWFFPAFRSSQVMFSSRIQVKSLAFFITMIMVGIFIESIALPVPGQLQFILIYAGLGAVAYRLLNEARVRNSFL